MPPVPPTLTAHFAQVPDPRVDRTKDHQLLDIHVIAICAILCGANDWVGIATFGTSRLAWFRTFLELANGIPSHDTFGRVFARLDPETFAQAFLNWTQAIRDVLQAEVIAIDGKTLRRSHDKGLGKGAIDMVSAWATANHLVLGQRKTAEKSNEITAIPELLRVLDVAGCIVTIDAMGCQTKIVETIVERGGDYIIAVKESHAHAGSLELHALLVAADSLPLALPALDTVSHQAVTLRLKFQLFSVAEGDDSGRTVVGADVDVPEVLKVIEDVQ